MIPAARSRAAQQKHPPGAKVGPLRRELTEDEQIMYYNLRNRQIASAEAVEDEYEDDDRG